MGTLTKKSIVNYLKKDLPDRLIITPLLDFEKQVKDTSIDLRLGPEFIITQKTNFSDIDPTLHQEIKKNIGSYQTMVTVPYHKQITLHPNQLLLGSTLEFICMPRDLCGYVIGRSSWGRLGLIIATATFVNQGFKGCLTLELVNLGEVPIVLYPGLRICQLILHQLDGDGVYDSRYKFPVGPEFSRIYDDSEMDFWGT